MSEERIRPLVFPALMAGVIFTVYFVTLAKTVTFGDSGELTTACFLDGVAHPTGYPLYVIIGNIFSKLPLGSVAFRINLMSAFFAAMSVFLAHLIAKQITGRGEAGAAAGIFLGFSHLLWSQAVIAEVYSLLAFLSCLLIYIALQFRKSRPEFAWIFFFLSGLSLGNHILIVPVICAGLYLMVKAYGKDLLRAIPMSIIFFLAGIAIYLHLPLSSFRALPLNYGDMRDPVAFIRHVTASEYLARQGAFRLQDLLLPFNFLVLMLKEYFIFTGLAILGMYYLKKKKKPALLDSLGIIMLINILAGITHPGIFTPVHFIPSLFALVILISCGFTYIMERWGRQGKVRATILFLLLFFPAYTFLNFHSDVDRSEDRAAFSYIKYMDAALPPGAVFIARSDEDFFPLVYNKIVAGRMQEDVLLYYKSLVKTDRYSVNTSDLKALSDINRKVYQEVQRQFPGYPVYIATGSQGNLTSYNTTSFPLKRIAPDELSDALKAEILDSKYLLFYRE